VTRLLARIRETKPALLYKKVDSVLRGNVLAEIEAALAALQLDRCLLISANPSAGRVIRRGKYFLGETPLDRTDFRHDPHHPRFTANVAELLGKPASHGLSFVRPGARTLRRGINVGEVSTVEDVSRLARLVNERTLAVGGADFFRAILEQRGFEPQRRKGAEKILFPFPPCPRASEVTRTFPGTLFVSGSLAKSSFDFLNTCRDRGWPVLTMPEELFEATRREKEIQSLWVRRVIASLKRHPKVAMAIGCPALPGKTTPRRIGNLLTGAVAAVLSEARPARVCVEGGATAALLVERMGWRRLFVEREFSQGVTGVRPAGGPDLLLVCKPGSYSWPAELTG
jgi:uncharacterized protein YgbK (DUF1537 family)